MRARCGSPQPSTFDQIAADVQACRRCPTMEGRRRVLGPDNGPVTAQVQFIAEAPGRLGGERTGVPLTGDQTGRNFLALLESIGWRREDVFVTNAVLCNPRAGANNRTPNRTEIANCREHLAATLAVIDPAIVVTLGRIALDALCSISPHAATLAQAGTPIPWNGRTLLPLYHPGPRAQIHRSFAAQQRDFAVLLQLAGSPYNLRQT